MRGSFPTHAPVLDLLLHELAEARNDHVDRPHLGIDTSRRKEGKDASVLGRDSDSLDLAGHTAQLLLSLVNVWLQTLPVVTINLVKSKEN